MENEDPHARVFISHPCFPRTRSESDDGAQVAGNSVPSAAPITRRIPGGTFVHRGPFIHDARGFPRRLIARSPHPRAYLIPRCRRFQKSKFTGRISSRLTSSHLIILTAGYALTHTSFPPALLCKFLAWCCSDDHSSFPVSRSFLLIPAHCIPKQRTRCFSSHFAKVCSRYRILALPVLRYPQIPLLVPSLFIFVPVGNAPYFVFIFFFLAPDPAPRALSAPTPQGIGNAPRVTVVSPASVGVCMCAGRADPACSRCRARMPRFFFLGLDF